MSIYLGSQLITQDSGQTLIPSDSFDKLVDGTASGNIYLEDVTTVTPYSFSGCANLTGIELPNATEVQGSLSFSSTNGLSQLILPSIIDIGFSVRGRVEKIDLSNATTISYGSGSVSANVFSGTFGIIDLSSLTEIPNGCFASSSLTKLILKNVVTVNRLGEDSITGCSLATLDLPETVQTLNSPGWCCHSLSTLIIRSPQMCTLNGGEYAFNGYKYDDGRYINIQQTTPIERGEGSIYVPDNLVSTYQNNIGGWAYYASQIKPLSEYVEE